MQDFLYAFWRWFAVSFVLALIAVYRMESVGVIDNDDIWYTLYCALGIAVPAAAVCTFFGKNLLSGWWRIRR